MLRVRLITCSRRWPVSLGIAALWATTPGAAQAKPEPERSAVILKQEVDSLLRALRQQASENGTLGDGTCRQTAMVLTAAGHCHRFYHAGDGPWLRRAVDVLFIHRRGDGAFVDDAPDDGGVTTTRWVLGALEVMSPDTHDAEIEGGLGFLRAQNATAGSPFDERVEAARQAVRTSDAPIEALVSRAQQALQTFHLAPPPGEPTASDRVAALVEVVACQVVARQGVDPRAETAEVLPWSPTQERGFLQLSSLQRDGVFGVEHEGNWYPDAGLTGMALAALLTKPLALQTEDDRRLIDHGLEWLLAAQNEDGSFGRTNLNYTTCAAVLALTGAPERDFSAALSRAQRYILAIQNVEEQGFAMSDRDYGSIGYGGDERGDLSNLQFAVEALRKTEIDPDHEAFAKAIVFLQRTQNLRSHNDFSGRTRDEEDGAWCLVAPGDDGGAAYYPGNSPAGYVELADGTRVPRSYGSMTYALLKTYTLCGVPASDPRVQAAVRWIESNWTLEVNPGVDPGLGSDAAYQGLFYYYMVAAQALDTAGMEQLQVAGEQPLDWQAALRSHLESLQRSDGSWFNERNGRWWENQPIICTIYAMLALDRCGR